MLTLDGVRVVLIYLETRKPSQGLLCGKAGDMERLVHASRQLAWTTMNHPPSLDLAEPHGAPISR